MTLAIPQINKHTLAMIRHRHIKAAILIDIPKPNATSTGSIHRQALGSIRPGSFTVA
jgi:hypothetical protein